MNRNRRRALGRPLSPLPGEISFNLPVSRLLGRIEINRDPPDRRGPEPHLVVGDDHIGENIGQADQVPARDGILEAGERGLEG